MREMGRRGEGEVKEMGMVMNMVCTPLPFMNINITTATIEVCWFKALNSEFTQPRLKTVRFCAYKGSYTPRGVVSPFYIMGVMYCTCMCRYTCMLCTFMIGTCRYCFSKTRQPLCTVCKMHMYCFFIFVASTQ